MKHSLPTCVLLLALCHAAFAASVPTTTCTEGSGATATTSSATPSGQCTAGKTVTKRNKAVSMSSAAPGESQGGEPLKVVTLGKPAQTKAPVTTTSK